MRSANAIISTLGGSQVQSVVLLPGHIQINFEGATLTCLRFPELRVGDDTPARASATRLEALWQFVGHKVLSAAIEEDDRLVVNLDNGQLRLDLREGSDAPLEIGILHLETGEEVVF